MINILLYILISGIFVLDWLFFRYGIGIRQMTWMPEFISIFVAISIPFKTAFSKQINLPLKYSILLIIYVIHLVTGFLLNDINGWVVLSGLRIYTKFIPVFLLPIIYPFDEKDFKKIIFFVYVLSMMQFPVVLYQRFIKYAASLSGDPMGGTLGYSASGILAIFLLIIISFLISFYFKEIISLPVFLLSAAAAFLPLTMNETKITFILLPLAFIFPAIFIKAKRTTIFRVVLVVMILFVSFFILKMIYNHFQQKRWGYGIETFVAMPGRLNEYSRMRLDPIRYSFINAFKDPRFIFFGRGAGNASIGFTKKLNGKYLQEAEYYGVHSVSLPKMIWEIGIMGTIIFLMFPLFIFLDSVVLSKKEGIQGAFALGMLSFCVFFSLSILYTFTMDSNLLMYLFFLSAGHIVNEKYIYIEEKEKQNLVDSTLEDDSFVYIDNIQEVSIAA